MLNWKLLHSNLCGSKELIRKGLNKKGAEYL
jgi:hypothetical protein